MAEVDNHVSEPQFDFPELLARVDNDRDFLRELLSLFQSECPLLVQALRGAVSSEDMQQVRSISHTLKGMLANIAAGRASAAASRLEQIGSIGDESKLKAAFALLESEIADLLQVLDPYLRDATL